MYVEIDGLGLTQPLHVRPGPELVPLVQEHLVPVGQVQGIATLSVSEVEGVLSPQTGQRHVLWVEGVAVTGQCQAEDLLLPVLGVEVAGQVVERVGPTSSVREGG